MLARKIAYNTLVSVGARIIGLALSLITLGFLTRYLGQAGYGQYATALAFLYVFSVFADVGLYSICIREISRPGADEKKIASVAFTIRFSVSLLVFVAAPVAALLFPYSAATKIAILIGAAGYWFMSSQQVMVGIFQKYLRMDKVAIAEFLSRVFQLGLVVYFIKEDMGLLYLVAAFVGGAFLNFALVYFFAQKHIPLKLDFDFSYWKKILKQSLPLGIATVLTMIYFKLDTVMLSVLKSEADVGIYGLAYKILESLLFFPAVFIGLMMPLMSKYALAAKEKFKQITQKALDVLLIFTVPLVIGILFLSPKVIYLIAGSQFAASAGVLSILILATGIIYLAVLFSNMIIALEKQKALAYAYGIGALINVAANLIYIPKYSYYGAAATTLFTELVVTAIMLYILYKALHSLPSFKFIFKIAVAAIAMALVLYILANLNFWAQVTIAALAYFAMLYLIGGISLKELKALVKKET